MGNRGLLMQVGMEIEYMLALGGEPMNAVRITSLPCTNQIPSGVNFNMHEKATHGDDLPSSNCHDVFES